MNEENSTIEFHGRKILFMNIDINSMPLYLQEILINGYCESLLLMGIADREKGRIYYDCSRTLKLKDCYEAWKLEDYDVAASMIEQILRIIEGLFVVENCLFINSGFRLQWEHVFFTGEKGKAKFALEPDTKESWSLSNNISEKVKGLIEQSLHIINDDEWTDYGKQLLGSIKSEDSLQDVARKLNLLGRDISSRDWPDLSNLRQF